MRIFHPVAGRETDHYSFRSKIFCVRHIACLIAGLPIGVCFALLIIFWPLQRFLGHIEIFQSFYSFPIHMYSSWWHLTLRLLGIEVIEIGDDVWHLRREGGLIVGEETSNFSLLLIEQTIARHFMNVPYVSMTDSPKTVLNFFNKARGFYIFESENDKEVNELEIYMKNVLPHNSSTLFSGVSNPDLRVDESKVKILTAGMRAIHKILGKFSRQNGEMKTDLPLRWILHTSLVCKPDVSCTDLLLGDVFASTKIFIVNKMYNADEVPHDRAKLFDWFEARIQEKKAYVEALQSNGPIPEIYGNHTPFGPRPLRMGSYIFALVFIFYLYALYFYAIHPALVLLANPR